VKLEEDLKKSMRHDLFRKRHRIKHRSHALRVGTHTSQTDAIDASTRSMEASCTLDVERSRVRCMPEYCDGEMAF
jgi:hypothetical protein